MASGKQYQDDDGRVVADMSGIERQPVLIPRFENLRGEKAKRPDFEDPEAKEAGRSKAPYEETVAVSKEERNAMIKGGIAAGLLIVCVIAAGFAALIFLLGHMGQ